MSTRRRFRLARERAASALLAYLEQPSSASERALVEAAHELEALAARRRLERSSRPIAATRLIRLAASR
jgi:hypothetical protein